MSDLPLSGQEALDLLGNVNLGIAYLDQDTLEVLFVSEVAAQLVGRTAAELIGASFLDLVEEKYHPEVQETIPKLLAGEQDLVEDVRLIHARWGHVYLEIHATPVAFRGKDCLACFLHEVTERRRVEKELRRTKERFKTLFNRSRDGILAADPETKRFYLANKAMCEMLGYTRDELLSLGVEDIHPQEDLPRVSATFEAQVRGDYSLSPDIPVKRKDGSVFYAEINSYVVEIDGHPLLLGNFRDASDRRRINAQLAQTDRMASLGLLAAGVAHEVNNPLTYVLYNIETMAEQIPRLISDTRKRLPHPDTTGMSSLLEETEELPAMCDETLKGLLQVRDIIHDLKRFSRVEEDERGPVEVNAVLESAVRMAFNQIKYRAQLVRDLGPLPPVMANEGRLCQVFLNLLVNAANAIEEGAPDDNTVTLRSWRQAGEVCVEVRDTGRGAPPEAYKKLFDPFYSAWSGDLGQGMGLSISRAIVNSLGGRIEAAGAPGAGTWITVTLPAREAEGQKTRRRQSTGRVKTVGASVLVVDDEPQVARVMGRMLRRAGYQVSTVTSVEAAQEQLDAGEAYDLIICDLMMPGLTGMDLHTWLEAEHPMLCPRTLYVTGGVFTPRAERFLSQEGVRWLEKPIDRKELFKTMETLLAGQAEE